MFKHLGSQFVFSEQELRGIYRYDPGLKAFNIDVKADFYQDIANEWDFSPIQRRDLDDDLKDFLYESISEIPRRRTVILNFHLPGSLRDEESEKRSIDGIRNFLSYTIRIRFTDLRDMIRGAFFYALLGILLLILSANITRFLSDGLFRNIVPEGLYVGGWVMIWEFFSIIFFRILEITREIGRYKRLMAAPIQYHYHEDDGEPGDGSYN